MPTYVYESMLMPAEALKEVETRKKVARINYWKKFGEDPPGWLIGVGTMYGKRFVLEDEFIAQELVVKTESYGFIAFQKPVNGGLTDRGWLITFFKNIEFDGRRCTIT